MKSVKNETMREHKFKVWDNVDYMSAPFTLQDLQEKKIQFTKDCVVLEFTGLLDCDGTEIYSGEVMEGGLHTGFVERGIYELGSDKSGFPTWIVNCKNNSGYVLVCDKEYKCREKIICNIYEPQFQHLKK